MARHRDYNEDKLKVLSHRVGALKRMAFLRRYYLEIILYVAFIVAVALFLATY